MFGASGAASRTSEPTAPPAPHRIPRGDRTMELIAVPLAFPADCNVVVGQSHFIKTVEDVAEIVVTTVPQAKFGLAFCEASGPCLVRTEGNDAELVAAAAAQAQAVGAGHVFFLVLRGAYP